MSKSDNYSEDFKQQEAKAAQIKKDRADQEIADNTMIFISDASEYRIANFKQEIRSGDGKIILQREKSIPFMNYIYTTSDPEEIAFIKGSDAFEAGRVKQVDTMEQALAHRSQVLAQKQALRRREEEDVSTEDITLEVK